MYKISLVAPVYGVEKYIEQFLDSIRKQTFKNFEAILVDDGSKDDCPRILDEFAKEDVRYKVIHQENGGVSKARNIGLEHVSGEYVYIVDSDDWLEPTALEVMWKEAEKNGADLIYGDWVRERSTGSERLRCFPTSFVTENPKSLQALQFATNNQNYRVKIARPEFKEIFHLGGAPWRGMIKAAVIKDNHLEFDPYVKGLGDDILFSLHLYEHLQKVSYVQSVIYHYRIIDASYSHGYKANYLESVERIYEKQETFLKQNNKNQLAWIAYYHHVLIYLLSGMKRYFGNEDNPKSREESYQEFRELLKAEPYRSAIKESKLRYMGSRKIWVTTLLLKLRLYRLYWVLMYSKTD